MHVPEVVMLVFNILAHILQKNVQPAFLQKAVRDLAGLHEHLHGFLGRCVADDNIDLVAVRV